MWSLSLFLLGEVILHVCAMPWLPGNQMNSGSMNAMDIAMMTNMNANANMGFANMNGMVTAMSNGNVASGPPTAAPNPNNAELMDEAAEMAADARAMQQAQAAKQAAASNGNTTANTANNTVIASTKNTSSSNSSKSAAQSVPNFGMGFSMVPWMMYFQRGGRMIPVYVGVGRLMSGNNVNMANSGSGFANTMPDMMGMNRQFRMGMTGGGSPMGPMGINTAPVRMNPVNNMGMRMTSVPNAHAINNARLQTVPDTSNAVAINAANGARSRANAMNIAYMNALRNMANQMANMGMGNRRLNMNAGQRSPMRQQTRMETQMMITPMRANGSTRFMRNNRNMAHTGMNQAN